MTIILQPDAEKLYVDFLLAQAEVVDIFDQAIFTALPAKGKQWPAARVTRIGGAPDYAVALWHETARLQVDVWGGPKKVAHDGAQTIRAVTAARIAGWPHDQAVVQLATFGDLLWLPDDTMTPGQSARPRYIFDVSIRLRPKPDTVS